MVAENNKNNNDNSTHYLFMWLLNSPKANYETSTTKRRRMVHPHKQGEISKTYCVDNNKNSINANTPLLCSEK
jgi:heptaprenylglyceryl phosphate synthase